MRDNIKMPWEGRKKERKKKKDRRRKKECMHMMFEEEWCVKYHELFLLPVCLAVDLWSGDKVKGDRMQR